jgi:hypothetical protein|tara:strand:+ start:112 stop:363 length:252 start_codon:yes stop_codon:yes gene_type:complete
MKVRTKKQSAEGVVRLEASEEIKEIITKEDFMNPKEVVFEVCFCGEDSAGVVELTNEEVKTLHKEVSSKKKLLGKIKVMKFKK